MEGNQSCKEQLVPGESGRGREGTFWRKKVWKCIRDMQRGRRGLLPSKAVVIEGENGEPCSSSTS